MNNFNKIPFVQIVKKMLMRVLLKTCIITLLNYVFNNVYFYTFFHFNYFNMNTLSVQYNTWQYGNQFNVYN